MSELHILKILASKQAEHILFNSKNIWNFNMEPFSYETKQCSDGDF